MHSTRFILLETSHPGNVGAAARAMKVMGFSDLVLVAPRYSDILEHPEALAFCSGATDVLQSARIVANLEEALDGIDLLLATAMTPRDFGPPTLSPREGLAPLAQEGRRIGFLFGSERFGMRNEDVYRCHACLSIPTHPDYGSLNLAQAVQIIAYEWRQALGSFEVQDRASSEPLADVQSVQRLLSHWEQALVALGFLDPHAPKKLMPRLQRMLNRWSLTSSEVHILHGVARSAQRAALATLEPCLNTSEKTSAASSSETPPLDRPSKS